MLFFRNKPDDLVLGRTGKYNFFPKFRISARSRQYHTYVVGLTGRGKSKFLQNCLVQDIMAGRGCGVIDPHGDLAKDVMSSLIAKGFFENEKAYERIIYVAPRRRDYVIPFNVLARPDAETETYEIAQRVISAFMRAWARTLLEPPRFQQIMRASLAVLIENGETLCSLYRLLTDDEFREEKLASIQDPKVAADCLTFFRNEFDKWGRDRPHMIGSTTNKISALTDNPSLFYMLSQKENHLNIQKIMDEGKVLLVDLGDCDDETKRLLGTLIVTGFEQAALSRSRTSMEQRKPFYLYIDEFQDFACHPGAAETFSQMLSQVRKYGLHLILANQSIAQLSKSLQTALGNAQTIVVFRISRADAEVLARVLGQVDSLEIKREAQTPTQHPIFSPLPEQWESFVQFLTMQEVRQCIVKTADDRLAAIWAEKVFHDNNNSIELERVILCSLRQHNHALGASTHNLKQVKPVGPRQQDKRYDTLFGF
ncbi:MAG: type IV secretion system DNA-binding domain-containing protein [Anaerolineales bacterium]